LAGESDTEEEDVYDEWKNLLLRETLALSGIVKVKTIKSSTFFTKGRLFELADFLKKNKNVEVIFINATLTVIQKRNLEMYNLVI
jgi:50S ribosomal subunit-associated GTPase HflX